MHYASPEEARKHIDGQLIDLNKRVLELKVERNTYAPFANLPADILLDVFETVKEGATFSAWYQVMGVCRQWRTVAVAAPTLWMNPPTDKHEMTLLMLERSREASLGIDLNDKSSSDTLSALRNHVERIRELAIQQTPLSLRNTQESLFTIDHSFTRLEDIHITSTRKVPSQNKAFVLSSVPLCQSSALRSVRLSFIGFDWGIFPVPNLTHLSLRNIHHTAQIPGDQLIQILRQMPYLETLSLDPWAFMNHNMPGPSANKATLHHLSQLRIRVTTPTQAQYLLSHMSLPLLGDLIIYCNHVPDTTDSDYSGLFQAIFCAITNGSFGMLESLVLYAHDFEIGRPPEDDVKYNVVEFTLQDDGAHDNASIIAKALTSFIDASNVLAHLPRLDLFPLLRLSELLPLCDLMVSVETIEVSDYAFNALIMALETRGPPDMIFPKLKTIILEHYDFYEEPEYLPRLRNSLKERRECGAPVHEMFLKECTIADIDINWLREIVASVQIIRWNISLQQKI